MLTVSKEKRNSIEEKIEVMLNHVLKDEIADEKISSEEDEKEESFDDDINLFMGRDLNKPKTAKPERDPKWTLNEDDNISPSDYFQRGTKKCNTDTSAHLEIRYGCPFGLAGTVNFNKVPFKRNSVMYCMNGQMQNYPQMANNQPQYHHYVQIPRSTPDFLQFQMQNMLKYQEQLSMQDHYMNLNPQQTFNGNMQRCQKRKTANDITPQGIITQNHPNFAHHSNMKTKTIIEQNDKNLKNELTFYELELTLTKSDKIDNAIFAKLKGSFVNIIKNQKGSRIFQNYLHNTSSGIIHLIFCEIQTELICLIVDPYANYFCQKFFSFLCQTDRILFLTAIESSLLSLSVNKIGTYPIQGIIEQIVSKEEKDVIVNGIRDILFDLATDTYGTHVVEKIVSSFEEEYVGFIYDFVLNNFLTLANHNNGLCVVKKLVTMTGKKDLHEKIKSLLLENAITLVQNPYGNYVLQVCIDTWTIEESYPIISQFKNKFVNLSMHKYSSNVVERCLEKSEKVLVQFISEMTLANRVADVMKNNFGNYVVQKALKLCSGLLKSQFMEEITKNIHKLKEKKLITKWKSILTSSIETPDHSETCEKTSRAV